MSKIIASMSPARITAVSWVLAVSAFVSFAAALAVALVGFGIIGFSVGGVGVAGVGIAGLPPARLDPGTGLSGVNVAAFGPGKAAPAERTTAWDTLGRCWTATWAEAEEWDAWEGGEPVACSEGHSTYTFAIEALPGLFGATPAASGAPVRSQGERSDRAEAADAAAATCKRMLSDLFSASTQNPSLIASYSFLPTSEEWARGERWVRCDLGVLALGTPQDDPSFGLLPADIETLVTAEAAMPVRYRYCVTPTPLGAEVGPLGDSFAVLTDCSSRPVWNIDSTETLAGGEGAAYPGDGAALGLAGEACHAADRLRGRSSAEWWMYYPSESEWEVGGREVDCWSVAQ